MSSSPTRVAAWERRTEWPLAMVAVLFLVAYAWLILEPDMPQQLHRTLELVDYAAWAVFGADYVVRVAVAERRGRYVFRNLPDLLILALPVLRPLRLLRSSCYSRCSTAPPPTPCVVVSWSTSPPGQC